MMLFENRNVANTFYIQKKMEKDTDVDKNFNILSENYYGFKFFTVMLRLPLTANCTMLNSSPSPTTHHPYLQHVSASYHLLEHPQVRIKPVCHVVLLVHHYMLG